MSRRALAATVLAAGAAVWLTMGLAQARPIVTREGVLPPGSDLNEELLDQPTELFSFEQAGGKRSYQFNLGDMLFESPAIFGGVARAAGISCNTCHQQGTGNAKLYVPGLSSRPGTFDVSNALFNRKADDGVFTPVTPPSLRGVRHLAPYGHDGRFASLRHFIRNVIVNEFAGPEPSPQVLDALVTYVKEISFLPNPKLEAGGRLNARASDAARRGQMLFVKPFRRDATMSCASCHRPDGAFVDHVVHNVGTGGLFKTPTLLNANFNAPYFHDGRYDNYAEVVGYFDRHFDLGFSESEKADLVAYLQAVGDGKAPVTRNTVQAELDEIAAFASVLDTAIAGRDKKVIALTVDSVGREWRELGESFPAATDTSVHGGAAERRRARGAVNRIVLTLRRIAMAAESGDFAGAAQAYADYKNQAEGTGADLKVAEAWSLFNPTVRQAHFAALNRLAELAR